MRFLASNLHTLDPLLGPPTAKNSYPKFWNPKTTFELFKKKKNQQMPQWPEEVSQNFGGLISYFLCEYKPPVKFQNFN